MAKKPSPEKILEAMNAMSSLEPDQEGQVVIKPTESPDQPEWVITYDTEPKM